MNIAIQKEIDILWSGYNEINVEDKIEAFERIRSIGVEEDLTQLIEALQSQKSDF